MSLAKPNYQVVLTHEDDAIRTQLQGLLEGLGHEVVLATHSGEEFARFAREHAFDLVLSSVALSDGWVVGFLVRILKREPRPVIVVTTQEELHEVHCSVDDHVMSFLVQPVTTDTLRAMIQLVMHRFEEMEALREEVEDLQEALRARKIIEKAKGILMRSKNLPEEEAHRRLQVLASRKRKKLSDVAAAVVLSEEL